LLAAESQLRSAREQTRTDVGTQNVVESTPVSY
jgi:hypothetical protein